MHNAKAVKKNLCKPNSIAYGMNMTQQYQYLLSLAPSWQLSFLGGSALGFKDNKQTCTRKIKFAFLYISDLTDKTEAGNTLLCNPLQRWHNPKELWCCLIASLMRILVENKCWWAYLTHLSTYLRSERAPVQSLPLSLLCGLLCLFEFETAIMWKCCKYK